MTHNSKEEAYNNGIAHHRKKTLEAIDKIAKDWQERSSREGYNSCPGLTMMFPSLKKAITILPIK